MDSGNSRPVLPRLLGQLAGAALATIAVFFCLWFHALNPGLAGVFRHLADPWAWGAGDFDWGAFVAGAGVAVFCSVLGWFLLESVEIYLPRAAAAALALTFGMSLAGFVLECLAIPYWLERRPMALALGVLLAVLALTARRGGNALPESGIGGEAGADERRMRRDLARQAYGRNIDSPRRFAARCFFALCLFLIAAITAADFWHALLYNDVYWDSLILYLGYARQTFLQHGFPIKVTGQVGIGLGANYPHLYSVLGSGTATVLGRWSELPQRFWAPLFGVASTVLVYHSALRLTRKTNAAAAIALLYRSIPLGIAYDQYASDYAMAMLFAAAFLYLALRAIETGMRGWIVLSALLVALSMHLNYLMGILWLPWAATLWLSQSGWSESDPPAGADPGAPWTAVPNRPGLGIALGSGWLWRTLLICAVVGSTWHIRNWIVTGNPVYAFFYKTLGGKNINPEVMDAAAGEWMVNGAGIGGMTDQIVRIVNENAHSPKPIQFAPILFPDKNGLLARLQLLPEYFLGSPIWWQGYQLEPVFAAFVLGGLLVWLGRWLSSPMLRDRASDLRRLQVRFGSIVVLLAFGLIAFHVVLAPFYLYQIIKILPCLALIAALAWPAWNRRPWRWIFGGLALLTGIVPGLAMALMGFKVPGIIRIGDQTFDSKSLFALRHPLPEPREMYRWRYGDDQLMWYYINTNLRGEKLLTHENRDLVFDPSITIVNLDDWDIQQKIWTISDPAERVRRLVRDFNIHYYLYIPNEDAAVSNSKMGAKEWEKLGLAELVFETTDPPNRLYRLTPKAIDSATTRTTPSSNPNR